VATPRRRAIVGRFGRVFVTVESKCEGDKELVGMQV